MTSQSNISATPALGDSFVSAPRVNMETKKYLRASLLFVLFGVLIYLGLYVVADQLIYRYAKRNRFFAVKTAPLVEYDYVILGASHAATFDYEDMNAQLEQMTHSKILNLSVVGGGITVNRVMLEYFLANHQTRNAIYFLDSFAFYSREWNEDRLNDTRLFDRAPFDPTLAQVLFQNPSTRSVALDYVVGFSRINNADRFKPDISDDEATKFKNTYRPVKQIDTQRLDYLYPKQIDQRVFRHYMAEFEDLVRYIRQHNIHLVVIKPPIPTRFYNMLPSEAQFDQALKAALDQNGIEFLDFSLVGNEEKFYFNTDHLNRIGVLNFFENHVKAVLSK